MIKLLGTPKRISDNSKDIFNEKIKPELTRRQREVFENIKYLCACKPPYISQHEYSANFNKPRHTFSGRFTELEKKGLIEKTGRKDSKGNAYYKLTNQLFKN